MELEDVRSLELFDGLDEAQLEGLVASASEVRFASGEELWREGNPADAWWVLLDGRIDLVRQIGREESVLRVLDAPGRWAGGFRAWDEHGVYPGTGRASAAGRVLCVPAKDLRRWSTRWFPFGTHILDGVFRTARIIESEARRKEALVALGTLAAGLAHEINNPAAAVSRAVDALQDASATLIDSVGRLAGGPLPARRVAALDALRHEINPPPVPLSPLAVADREEVLSTWLSDHGVERDWLIAPALAAGGVEVAWCERAGEVLGDEALEPGLEWVASALSTTALLSEVKESTRHISELVAAVKSYSQLDRASMQQTNVAEGLESTLVMLAHRIDGVTVVRDYGTDVPSIQAIAAELNQVWTNLIDNGLDAMAGAGTLRASTRAEGDGVLVEVGDTGTGFSRHALEHAFEPFFTTKGVGHTGLGLDISRRIIDRHGGEITIDPRPGETVLRVRLRNAPPRARPG